MRALSNVLIGLAVVLAATAFYGTVLALGVYSYNSLGSIIIFLWSMVCTIVYLCMPIVYLAAMVGRDNDERVFHVITCTAFFFISWPLNNLLIYLAETWGIEMAPHFVAALAWPQNVFNYLGNFFGDFFNALFGINLRLPTIAPSQISESGQPPASVNASPFLGWALSSIWSIVLGIVSTIICTAFARRA